MRALLPAATLLALAFSGCLIEAQEAVAPAPLATAPPAATPNRPLAPVAPVSPPQLAPQKLAVKWEGTMPSTVCAFGYCQGGPILLAQDDKVGRFVEHKPGPGVATSLELEVKWTETPAPPAGPTETFASVHCMVPSSDYYCKDNWQLAFIQGTQSPFRISVPDIEKLPEDSWILIRFGVLPRNMDAQFYYHERIDFSVQGAITLSPP